MSDGQMCSSDVGFFAVAVRKILSFSMIRALSSSADPLLGHDVEVGRLLQLDGQRLFERTIENRLPSCIDEAGQQNGILHSQPLGAMHVNQDSTSIAVRHTAFAHSSRTETSDDGLLQEEFRFSSEATPIDAQAPLKRR
jgi:hypothetical protein